MQILQHVAQAAARTQDQKLKIQHRDVSHFRAV